MDVVKDLLLKYKLIILIVLILVFIGSCHCIKPKILKKVALPIVKKENN
tara:strand:- start:1839 stop:1985 length:147 start_codon:yes stop_codon:yes gene_type:complete